MEKPQDLEKLKTEYEILKKKYSLPDFKSLAEDFEAERASEKESTFILREIRRTMGDKISAYLHLFESFLNPSSVPIFVFAMLKNMNDSDRKKIREFYDTLARFEIEVFKLDTVYDEKSEAEFIKNVYAKWIKMRDDIYKLIDKIGKISDSNTSGGSKGYFG